MNFFLSYEIDGRYENFDSELRKIGINIENKIKECLKKNDYGNEVMDLTVIAIIIKFNEQMDKDGWFKERVLFKKNKKEADIRLRIDYNKFVKGDNKVKKLLLIDNIIKSINALSAKAKIDFNAKKLEEDILKLFKVKLKDIENL